MLKDNKKINILIPMAGGGRAFAEAGFTFPKPLIDVGGKTMIEVVINNLAPTTPHHFIFVCFKEHYDKYDLHNIFKRSTNNHFDAVTVFGATQGAACAALLAANHVDNEDELLIANSDQFILANIDDFISKARKDNSDGHIMTFSSSHPKWSYARINSAGRVMETAEKKVISSNATVGIYYFKKGKDFIRAAQTMIHKGITHENQFYICPSFNELIIENKKILIYPIDSEQMYGLGTPEDLTIFNLAREKNKIINLVKKIKKTTKLKKSKKKIK